MSWELRVYDPGGGTLQATYTETSPGGVVGDFRWSVRGDGRCLQMQFNAVPSSVSIEPWSVVQLLINGQPAFWGFISRSWPADDGRVREYVALGAYKKYEHMFYHNYFEPPAGDAATIADTIAGATLPRGVLYDQARFPASGYSTSLKQATGVSIAKILDDLAAAAGVSWGVDASGYVYFEAASGSVSVPYASSDVRWLPVEADDITTSILLVGPLPTTTQRIGSYDYQPDLVEGAPSIVIYYYESNYDVTYRAERAYAYQEPMLEPSTAYSNLSAFNILNTANALDGDETSYAEIQLGGTASYIEAQWPPAYGALVLIEQIDKGQASKQVDITLTIGQNMFDGQFWIEDTYTRTLSVPDLGVWPFLVFVPVKDLYRGLVYTRLRLDIPAVYAGQIRIRRLEAMAHATNLQVYAQGLIVVPYQRPVEVVMDGYVAPVSQLTVTGAPNGDVTGYVEEWDYEWSATARRSRAKLSRKTDPAAQAIRIMVDRARAHAEMSALGLVKGK